MPQNIEVFPVEEPRFELRSAVIDGVHCFGVPSDRPILTGVLRFNYGYAYEPFNESGWQHLIEHDALDGLETGLLDVNGTVSFFHTEFEATGPPAEVVTFFDRLTQWLSAPTFSDLDRTRRVLESEAGTDGPSPMIRALAWRWGVAGPGIAAFEEPGLGRATAERLTARCQQVFTQASAAMHFDGPIPEGLRLNLPVGEPTHRPPLVELASGPAQYRDSTLTLTGIIATGDAGATIDYIEHELTELVRYQAGITYVVDCELDELTTQSALVTVGIDLHASAEKTGAHLVFDWLDQQVAGIPDAEVITRLNAKKILQYADPATVGGISASAASNHAEGVPIRSNAEHQARRGAVTPDDVGMRLAQFRNTLLVGVPEEAEPIDDLPMLEFPYAESVPRADRWLKHGDWPTNSNRIGWTDDALITRFAEGAAIWRFDEIVGVRTYADSETRQWQIWRQDGNGFSFAVDEYTGWRRLVEVLEARVDPELFLPISSQLGEREGPFERDPWWSRWLGAFARWICG